MNVAAFATVSKLGIVNYAGPINPPAILWQKILSKFLRVAGSSGDFFFFSQRRLEAIADEVRARCRPEARLDFFHGFTPWILTRPQRSYIAWSDCTFGDYIDVYHQRGKFRSKDLYRIEQAEAAWLKNAHCVLFTSDWAAEGAVSRYGLDASRLGVVGICGEVELPVRDVYTGGKAFAFVSTNFAAKGGRTVLAALQEVRRRHPEAGLIIVGDRPSDAAVQPGVEVVGFLRKEVPEERRRFQDILGSARALVYPTRSDIAPLLLIEAGYCGCPVISCRRFAIPELVDDGRTGLLLDDSEQVSAVADAMSWMLEHENEYAQMRHAAWTKSREQHSKRRFEERLLSSVRDVEADRMLAQ